MRTRLLALTLLATAACAHGVSIELDYSYDALNGNFFGNNPAARAAVDAAAADISAVLLPSLGAINTTIFQGAEGGNTATFDWELTFANPSTGAMVAIDNFTIQADVLTIYVGMQRLNDATLGAGGNSVLGEGGPAGASYGLTGSISNPAAWPATVSEAAAASNAVMPRGGGPVMGSLSGSSTVEGNTASFTLSYGALGGNLWFDSDSNNDNVTDPDSLLSEYWHYDHTAQVAPGKRDLYSVALHEILHSMGVGTADTWYDLISMDGEWLGSSAGALNGGTGFGIVDPDFAHLDMDLLSTRLSDGAEQEVVMGAALLVGSRTSLTRMDLAILNDLGYATIPEPSTGALLAAALGFLAARRTRRPLATTSSPRLAWRR